MSQTIFSPVSGGCRRKRTTMNLKTSSGRAVSVDFSTVVPVATMAIESIDVGDVLEGGEEVDTVIPVRATIVSPVLWYRVKFSDGAERAVPAGKTVALDATYAQAIAY